MAEISHRCCPRILDFILMVHFFNNLWSWCYAPAVELQMFSPIFCWDTPSIWRLCSTNLMDRTPLRAVLKQLEHNSSNSKKAGEERKTWKAQANAWCKTKCKTLRGQERCCKTLDNMKSGEERAQTADRWPHSHWSTASKVKMHTHSWRMLPIVFIDYTLAVLLIQFCSFAATASHARISRAQ